MIGSEKRLFDEVPMDVRGRGGERSPRLQCMKEGRKEADTETLRTVSTATPDRPRSPYQLALSSFRAGISSQSSCLPVKFTLHLWELCRTAYFLLTGFILSQGKPSFVFQVIFPIPALVEVHHVRVVESFGSMR